MPSRSRVFNSAVLFGLCAAGSAYAQTSKPLPPVRLLPPDAAVAASQPQPAVSTSAPGTSVPASGGFTQPQAGTYAQPAAAEPAPTAGTYVQPKSGVTFSQPGTGTPATPPSQPTTRLPAQGSAASSTSARRISLGFTPSAPSTPPVSSAPAPTAPPSAVESVPPPRAMTPVNRSASGGKSSLPPPHLFAPGEPETDVPVATAEPKPDAPSVPTRTRAGAKYRAEPKASTLAVQPGKPLLDEYGVQRIDPAGKPMFSPERKQARDRHGRPLFLHGKPVFQTAEDPGFDEHGRRIKVARFEAPHASDVHIEHGAFTVDGIVGKVQLNYDIGELHFFYLYVPDTGAVIVSARPFPGAIVQSGAFRGDTLTVTTEEHTLAVSSTHPFFGKKPVDAYVLVDRGFLMSEAKFPVFGYGPTPSAPYVWPGSKKEEKLAGVSDYVPPVPKNLKPKLVGEQCPAGQQCPDAGAAGTTMPRSVTGSPAAAAPAVAPALAEGTVTTQAPDSSTPSPATPDSR